MIAGGSALLWSLMSFFTFPSFCISKSAVATKDRMLKQYTLCVEFNTDNYEIAERKPSKPDVLSDHPNLSGITSSTLPIQKNQP